MIKGFLKTFFRNAWKTKGYSSLNIFGLAIGIACSGLIFLWVENELNWDNNNVKKDHIYQLEVNIALDGNHFTMGSTPRPMGKAMQAEIPGIVNTARMSDGEQRLLFNVEDKSLYATGRFADPSLFNMFSFDFVQGDQKNPFQQLYSLVLTETAAKKFFGDENNVIGKIIRMDNKHDYVISGVVKNMPGNSTLQFEWLAPYEITLAHQDPSLPNDAVMWNSYGPFTYVELDKNANLASVNRQLKDFIHRKSPDQKTTTFLYPMSRWHLYSEFANGEPTGGGAISQVRLLSVIASIILLIACINYMNLATASSQKRAKEIGVRKVLGAEKKKLVFQFIAEALFMSALAAIVAIIILFLSLPAFNHLMQRQLSLHVEDPIHVAGLFIIIVVSGLIAGSYPSLYLSSFNPIFVLKGIKLKTGSAAFIRKGLVVFQFAISVVFIISTLIVYQQIQHIKNRDLGLNKNDLVEINPGHDVSTIFPLIKNDLKSTGVIENVALADHSTLYGGDTDDRFIWENKPANTGISIAHRNVSPEFVATSGMKIMEGRDFNSDALSENSNVIINESLAKLMGKESAVGKIVQSPRGNPGSVLTNMTVIGVVKDYVYGNIYGSKVAPLILFCKPPEFVNYLYVRLKRESNIEQVLAKIQEVMKKDNSAYPLEYRFVDDQFNQMFFNETQISKVSGIFASLAIIISCLGLFGLAAYTAERRVKEIGIRKVLGASVPGIIALLSGDFLGLIVIACLVSFPVAWWLMHSWLQNFEYRINLSWWIFLLAGSIAVIIALFTISFQAIKAAVANPVRSLRVE